MLRRLPVPPLRIRSAAGFSLVEMVGVLALLALLTWVTAESGLTRWKEANRQAEAATLAALAEASKQAVLRTRYLPDSAGWAEPLASELALSVNRVARNEAGYPRAFLLDPECRVGVPPVAPPFRQGPDGSALPAGARFVILSSLSDDLPDLAGLGFDSLWNQIPGQLPAAWPADWSGEPADLLIERVDFRPLFHRIILNNLETEVTAGYTVGGTNRGATVPPGARVDAWFIRGSVLELRSFDGSVQAAEIVREDGSYVFERRRWARQVTSGPVRSGGLGALVNQFLSAPSPPPRPARAGADQAAMADELFHYLRSYANWADQDFPHHDGLPGEEAPVRRSVAEAQARLRDIIINLTKE